ncbi:MAG: phosphate propanoyltransferase [Oscillospiraceae bacterium]|nr:phosphate propanoyltransferase [Oscillospiraceae bacterium]
MDFIVETSARHVHLSQADLETLFGAGHKLSYIRELSQPGQYACEERVEIAGPKKSIKNVIVLGPVRPASQVEISLTDARSVGIAALIRESGDLAGTEGCKLIGPAGEVILAQGVIAAKRHIHTTPEDAAKLGVADKETVHVKIGTDGRSLLFGDVVVRVSSSFSTAMHIDTDESNAAGANPATRGEIIKF